MLFSPNNWGFGGFYPQNGEQYQQNPKRHILARVCVVWAIPKTPILGAWIGIFKPNFSVNSNQILHSDKDHQMPFVGGQNTHNKSKMADGRHLGKIEKSPHLGRGLTDFDQIWHGNAVRPSRAVRPLKIEIWKIQDGGRRHLEKSENRHISATVRPIATKFGMLTPFEPLDHSVWKIGPSSCTFWLVYALDILCSFSKAFAVQNDKIAYLNLAIKQQICM